ncbi:MAG: hypothetical protein AB7V13_20680, partial [Pseudorhodoplanes sp.]
LLQTRHFGRLFPNVEKPMDELAANAQPAAGTALADRSVERKNGCGIRMTRPQRATAKSAIPNHRLAEKQPPAIRLQSSSAASGPPRPASAGRTPVV